MVPKKNYIYDFQMKEKILYFICEADPKQQLKCNILNATQTTVICKLNIKTNFNFSPVLTLTSA